MAEKSLKEMIQEEFDRDSVQLPVFNRVALELQRKKTDPHVTLDQISALIIKDQSLASRILRVANSSFYAGLRQVDKISQAVLRLGLERVTNLAMVAAQLLAHSAKVKPIAERMGGLWSRSFACATGGRWIAQQTGHQGRAEEVFLAALLHDLGELFLLKVMERLALNKEAPLALSEPLIAEVLESLHADLGYQLMLKWQLPETYARVARDHHRDEFDEGNELLVVTRLMDLACHKLGIGQPPDPEIVLAATPEAQLLGIKEIKLAELEVLLEDSLQEAQALLRG